MWPKMSVWLILNKNHKNYSYKRMIFATGGGGGCESQTNIQRPYNTSFNFFEMRMSLGEDEHLVHSNECHEHDGGN